MRSDHSGNRCRCGHIAMVHEHFRDGSDCGVCGKQLCSHYRPERLDRPALNWLRTRLDRARGLIT
jgi:hypothetical protein